MNEDDVDQDETSQETGAESGERAKIAGVVRDLALSGLATVFMTEDSVRKYLKDLKLPKEAAGFLMESLGKKKDDFYALAAKELGKFLSKVDVGKEIGNFLREHEITLKATFSFQPKHTKRRGNDD